MLGNAIPAERARREVAGAARSWSHWVELLTLAIGLMGGMCAQGLIVCVKIHVRI
jgi:hypothetical protein